MKKNTHGGKRAGAGKPKGSKWKSTLEKEAAYRLYREVVLQQMAPLVRTQVESAVGTCSKVAVAELTDRGLRLRRVTSEEELNTLADGGSYRVFLTDPDLPMSRYLTDQVVGKPTENVTVSGLNGGPVVVRFVDA
ncbi:MAG: hypothetical protein WCF16_02480 [Alphaproteobacteria bacterium]